MLRRVCLVKATRLFSLVEGISWRYTANHLCQRSHFVRLAEAMRSGRSAGIGPANSKERPTPSYTIPDLEFHQCPGSCRMVWVFPRNWTREFQGKTHTILHDPGPRIPPM